jgi:nickel-dependent lactate racemase
MPGGCGGPAHAARRRVTVKPIALHASGDETAVATTVAITTAAWYGDRQVDLQFPAAWTVSVHEPDLPRPLGYDEILAALRAPIGAPSIATMAAGARRVVVIVDDLTRPTPVELVLPALLGELEAAGVTRGQVTILVATGTHGPASMDAIRRKVGTAAAGCRLTSHDDLGDCPRIGVSRMGTPVHLNREVVAADLVLGIGGVYPQHSTGFGGGSKLALGVLGRRSIARLHFGHAGAGGRYDVDNDFRADLDEIARMVGLRWTVMAHVDADRRIVRLVAGDPVLAYPAAAAFSRASYAAVRPGEADVVVSNAYPMDISATFMRSKGIIPLLHARPGASRILVAACPEGVGHHGLFPLEPLGGAARVRRRIDVARARGWRDVLRLAGAGVHWLARRRRHGTPAPSTVPILLYQTVDPARSLPERLPGMTVVGSWADVIGSVRAQQGGRDDLTVVVYPCAPLQVFE